ncbi:hypothetical protein ACIQJW_01290 [Streptomyces californicus]
MSGQQPVALEGIPVFTGDLALLDTKVTELAGDGAGIATATGDIHSSFGGLQAFYKAPEADQLFATTKPVADRGAALKSDLATITAALRTYSDDAHPLVEKLRQLKRDAGAFLVKVNAEDDWLEDGDLVEENNRRHAEIAETWAAFQAVELACYNKIISLVPGGKPLTTDDGAGGEHTYGYDSEVLKQAKGLPWGDPVEESKPWYHLHEHGWDFVKGFAVDGVLGTVKGLGTLVGVDGWEGMKQAWGGLAQLSIGAVITTATSGAGGVYLLATPEEHLPSWLRGTSRAMKETGKALIAYDQWGENPARAGGAVTFNVLTTVFTGGTGAGVSGAGKAALAAKAISFANKASRVVDPTTYLFKGAGAGLTKISNVMTGLKDTGRIEIPPLPPGVVALPDGAYKVADGTLHLPEGAAVPEGAFEIPEDSVKLPDGAELPAGAVDLGDGIVHLPEGTTPPAGSLPIQAGSLKLPEGTTALPEGTARGFGEEGNAVLLDREGNILSGDGTLLQHHSNAKRENPPADNPAPAEADTPLPRTPAHESALVGAGARGGNDIVRLGSDTSHPIRTADHGPPGSHSDATPGGNAGDNLPRNAAGRPANDDPLSRGSRSPHGSGAAHHDGSTSQDSTGSPPAGAGRQWPSGSANNGDGLNSRGGTQNHIPESPKRTAAEIKARQDDFIRQANDPDKTWFNQYYRIDGHRHSIAVKIDDIELPILAKDRDGSWISKYDLPAASSEVRFGREELTRGSAPVARIDHLDDIARDRKVSVDLANAERIHKNSPTTDTLKRYEDASDAFHSRLGETTSNSSKFSERLGEEAAALHVIPERFPDAIPQPLPKTANGANMFDQLYRRADGRLLIIEAKAPSSNLIWRKGFGQAEGLMVKQGTREYLQTIIAEMSARPHLAVTDATGKVWTNAQLVKELNTSLAGGNLDYALVKAIDGKSTYAGAVIEHFRI